MLKEVDPQIARLLLNEIERQRDVLNMIPSENYASRAVMEACGSVLTNKYSEGYPKKRYYQGNQFIDEIELLAIERAKELFNVPHVNVQPYSGSPANLAVYNAVCEPGDIVLGLNLPDGGHLTHGWNVSATGKFYRTHLYHVKEDGYIDFEEVWQLASKYKPRLIWCGATAYPREFPFEQFSKIADASGAYLAADIAHIAGLIAGRAHKSPSPFAHIITTTTHKTLRGPRGGMIFVTQKGLEKDPDLAKKIDRAVFPGLQGGPHNNTTAGIAVALKEALSPEFSSYARQIVANCKALAHSLQKEKIKLVSDGTDNHLLLIDLTPHGIGLGKDMAVALEEAGIVCNANTIPRDPSTPFKPSGLRMGTPVLTTRQMKEIEMEQIGKWIAEIIKDPKNSSLKSSVKSQVKTLCAKFPVFE